MSKNIYDFLIQQGYQGPVNDAYGKKVYWHRTIPGVKRHQYIVYEWTLPTFNGGFSPMFEVEMTYETKGGIWAQLKFYSLNETDLKQHLNDLEGRLKETIVRMGGNPEHYRLDGENR